jgi:hypothetical protein
MESPDSPSLERQNDTPKTLRPRCSNRRAESPGIPVPGLAPDLPCLPRPLRNLPGSLNRQPPPRVARLKLDSFAGQEFKSSRVQEWGWGHFRRGQACQQFPLSNWHRQDYDGIFPV